MFRLGVLYLNGMRVSKDLAAVREWFEAAASPGHQGAEAELERMIAPTK